VGRHSETSPATTASTSPFVGQTASAFAVENTPEMHSDADYALVLVPVWCALSPPPVAICTQQQTGVLASDPEEVVVDLVVAAVS
jgi:hypothetical protein